MVLVIACLFIQIFYIKNQTFQDETVMETSLKQERILDSYEQRYERFKENAVDKVTDFKIKDYLAKNGYGSILTDESIDRTKLI